MGLSRKLLSRLKLTEKGIEVNQQRRYVDYVVCAGDVVEVRLQKEESKVVEILQKYSDGIIIQSELDDNGARVLNN